MQELIAVYDREYLSSLTSDRRRTAVRVLDDFAVRVEDHGSSDALRALLRGRQLAGCADTTLRKTRAVVLAFAAWCWRAGYMTGDELLALRNVKLIGSPPREIVPQPYRPSELHQLHALLDKRWPLLDEYAAERWLSRFSEGRSPYSRVRRHAIGAQLRAVVALALDLALRRREIYALTVDAAHPANDQIVVFHDIERDRGTLRGLPYKTTARDAVARWIVCRDAIGARDDGLWLNTHAGRTCADPITAATFNRLLGTYVGSGWTLKRLRDTGAVAWVRAKLPPEKLQELLGVSRIEDVMPYYRLVGGSLADDMDARDCFFDELIGAVRITPVAA